MRTLASIFLGALFASALSAEAPPGTDALPTKKKVPKKPVVLVLPEPPAAPKQPVKAEPRKNGKAPPVQP